MMMSDFRPEVEISQVRACTFKNMQYNPYLWPVAENWRLTQSIVSLARLQVYHTQRSHYLFAACSP